MVAEIKARNRRRILRFVEISQRRDRRPDPAAAGQHFVDGLLDHPKVIEMQKRLSEKGDRMRFGQNRDGALTAGLQLAARLLKRTGDQMAKSLLALVNSDLVQARNHSLLIHGFSAISAQQVDSLRLLYNRLEHLLLQDSPDAESNLKLARFPNSFMHRQPDTWGSPEP